MTLEADIVERVRADFNAADVAPALDELSCFGKTGRIVRCIVVGAGGSLERLRELIGMAELDYRDVVVAGEYDDAMRHVRDLSVSFLIDSPDDFWICATSAAIYRRGYRLAQLKSRSAEKGPFEYTCDRSEGVATFSDGQHSLTVEKKDRQWKLVAGDCDLHRYGLDAPLEDEQRFRVQLDYYLKERMEQSDSQ